MYFSPVETFFSVKKPEKVKRPNKIFAVNPTSDEARKRPNEMFLSEPT